jgi:hypothetical protein
VRRPRVVALQTSFRDDVPPTCLMLQRMANVGKTGDRHPAFALLQSAALKMSTTAL